MKLIDNLENEFYIYYYFIKDIYLHIIIEKPHFYK